MKRQHSAKTAISKKPNIGFRRRLRLYYDRTILCLKCIIILTLYLLIFTKYLDSVKNLVKYHIYEYTADMDLVLENILIEGQKNIATDEIIATLNADVGTPILSINLSKVQESLNKNPWVKNSIVSRRLPKSIYIHIVEREPIAIWQQNQKLYLVDADGYVMNTYQIDKFSNLLHVVGPGANVHASALQASLEKDPELAKKIVSAVRYGERRWNLLLEQGLTVKMPEHKDFEAAFTYLAELYHSNKLFDQGYKYIDLRDISKIFFEKYPD